MSKVHDILINKHSLSPYLSSDIDIDNIDNIFRFAHHIGLSFSKNTPKKLASSLNYINGKLLIDRCSIKYFDEWFQTRVRLYKFLLEDFGEFVSKALLERIFIELVQHETITEVDWILVDSDIIKIALRNGETDARKCAQCLMTMNFPQKHLIIESREYKIIDDFLKTSKIDFINRLYKEGVFVHFIKDVNKTFRPIHCDLITSSTATESITIGTSQDRYLIGFFADSLKLINFALDELHKTLDIRFSPIRSTSSYAPQQLSLI